MSNEAVGTRTDSSHRQAQGHVDDTAAKKNALAGNAATTNQGASGSTNNSTTGAPSSGIATVGTQSSVNYLPPLAKAALESAAQPRPVEKTAPDWMKQLDARLKDCRTADDHVEVLKTLRDPELQRFVVDKALDRCRSLDEVDNLAKAVKDDASLRKLVADRLWQNATHSETVRNAYVRGSRLNLDTQDSGEPQRRKEFAAQCAASIITVLPENELGAFLTSHSKDEGAAFAFALGSGQPWREKSSSPGIGKLHAETARSIDRVLVTLNKMPVSPTGNAIVRVLCGQILPSDCAPILPKIQPFEARPLSPEDAPTALPPQHVATAIGRLWFPDDSQRADAAAARLKDLLTSRQGAQLMFGAKSPWERKLIFDVVRTEPGITAQTFANDVGDPIQHPVVATALARKLVVGVGGTTVPTPAQAAAREEAVQRVSDIIAKTDAGRNLISGPAPEKAKLEAWAAIIANPKITAKTFTSDNPFANTLLTDSIAPLYTFAGADQEYPGESFRNLAGFALGLTPTLPKDVNFTVADVTALREALAKGTPLKDLPPAFVFLFTQHSLFAKNEVLDNLVKNVKGSASTTPLRGAFEFNALFTELGPISCPAFRVQAGTNPDTGGPKYKVADNTSRIYADREDFLKANQYPPGLLYFAPHNPFGSRDKNGAETLSHRDTPATNKRVENAITTAALYGCFAAGMVGVVVSGGTLALAAGAVGAAGAGWDSYQIVQTLGDRAAHGQTIDPFASGDGGREAFMAEMGLLASATNMLTFGAGASFLGLSKLGAIVAKDAEWAVPLLSTVRTGAAGVNIGALTVTAADLEEKFGTIKPADRNKAVAMLVFYGVLAAKPVFDLRAQRVSAKPVPASEPTTRPAPAPEPPSGPGRPASLQPARVVWTGRSATLVSKMREFLTRLGLRDLAGKFEAELATWAELRAARGEPTTPRDIANKIAELAKAHRNELGDINLRGLNNALANPGSQQVGVDFGAGPANDHVPPAAEPIQQQQPVQIAANGGPAGGGPSFVPTGLGPTEPIAGLRPPGQRWPSSPPVQQPSLTPAATPPSPPPIGAGPGGHPVPPPMRRHGSSPRLGSEPERPPAQQPATEPTIVTPIVGGGAAPETALCKYLETHRSGLWEQIPPECRTSDVKAANWLHDRMGPEAWKDFANWLRNNNFDAYSKLPDALKLPADVRPVAPVRAPAPVPTDTALEGKLVAWLKEKEMWDAVPAEFKTSERKLAQWVHDVNPKQWNKFLRWLSKEHNDIYRRTQPESLIEQPAAPSTPPVQQNTQRGGRQLSATEQRGFVDGLDWALPRNPNFRKEVAAALKELTSQSANTNVSVGDVLQAVHDCAAKSFNPEAVAYLDGKLRKVVPDFTPGATTPTVVAGELGAGGPRFRPDNVLPIDVVQAGLRPQ